MALPGRVPGYDTSARQADRLALVPATIRIQGRRPTPLDDVLPEGHEMSTGDMEEIATRLAEAEARLVEIRRYLADHPEAHSLEEEELGLERFVSACKIVTAFHEFAVTMARLRMAERAHLN